MSPPVGGHEVSNKGSHWHLKYFLCLSGLLIGGCITASGIIVLGGFARPIGVVPALVILWLLLLMSVLVDTGALSVPLPQPQYLIPASRFERSLAMGIFVFSIELGLGIRTRISYAAPYVIAVYVLLLSDVAGSIVVVAGWALGRSALVAIYLPRLGRLKRRVDTTEDEIRDRALPFLERVGVYTGNCGRLLAPVSMTLLLLQYSYEWTGA